jgi:hypothetical protein
MGEDRDLRFGVFLVSLYVVSVLTYCFATSNLFRQHINMVHPIVGIVGCKRADETPV